MSATRIPRMPDHTDLPDSDGRPVENFLEHPQSILLTQSIWPVLEKLHPDGQFVVGQNSGIYWRLSDPPLSGCKAPDWFYVPNRPPMLNGKVRRSYVLWQELIAPTLLIEIVSGDGSEERDATPNEGKFWVYEQAVRAPYYALFDPFRATLHVFELRGGRYAAMAPSKAGRFAVAPMGAQLGLWEGRFANMATTWLRFYDAAGRLLPTGDERGARDRKSSTVQKRRAARLAAKLRELGIDPDQL